MAGGDAFFNNKAALLGKFWCPTREQITQQILALLPRGRAWQTREGGPRQGFDPAFDPGGFSGTGFNTDSEAYSIIRQFINAVSEAFYFVTSRLCDLQYEFWCATKFESHDQWMIEYGLPDACDPFPDLCTKVAAIGGTRCEYYQFIAWRAGWAIQCVEQNNSCGTRIGGLRSIMGRIRHGKDRPSVLKIVVNLNLSPSFTGNKFSKPRMGRFRMGRRLACGPSIGPLECILARVVHAEILISYEVVF